MKIFNHFQHINLTNDQRNALEKLHAFLESDERIFILQGYAGSGKTTLLKGLVEYLKSLEKRYQLMAPTGRAARVIKQKTGFESTTIHKGIYSFEELQEIKQGENENDVSFLYQYKIRNNPEVHDSVLIIDEASMVSDILSQGEFFRFGSGHLLRDLISYSRIQECETNNKIIFIGDPSQLPPIGMNFSPALDPNYISETYKVSVSQAEMKEVKRQEVNNGILIAATKIRRCLTSGYFNDFDLRENKKDIFNPSYQEFLETYNVQQEPKIIICHKNKTALNLNRVIRKDKFGDDLPIQPSDTVVIGANNYYLGIMNGEFAIVSEVSPSVVSRDVSFYTKGGKTISVKLTWRKIGLILPDEKNQPKTINGFILENYLYGENTLTPDEQIALYVDFKKRHPNLKKGTEEFKEAIIKDEYFNCILLKYGYAVTCHKAQGGEWPNAFVFWDKGINNKFNFYESPHNRTGKTNPEFFRWAYTAVTRASKRLFCINPPYFSSFSEMSFVDTKIQQAYNDLTGQTNINTEINIKEVLPELEKFGLENEPITIQDHFIHRWYYLRKQNINIKFWQKVGYEVRYIFKRESQTAGFKYWVNGQNVFNNNFQKLPAQTNSDELFETIAKILECATPILVNRNNAEGILTQIEFDIAIEEEKPFLKNLFDFISRGLSNGEVISNIQHLEYRERYTIKNHEQSCVIDFEYDKAGFFGRVLPLEKKCNSPELLAKIKSIVNHLKEADYVI
ncbi:ATP-dependent DNA helicase [Tenuifilum thalassicum]|uniref:AAA family ATPase n=1 Tax=Tenuifilum thalassicum TaxID=2590900 RepID=A0A7D3Y3E3_9BACT|nr:AAA family ATPase [Tenuifilum thalassicum]QKG79309.1 AAA family ATPase [Tenuifilum thalassicum]